MNPNQISAITSHLPSTDLSEIKLIWTPGFTALCLGLIAMVTLAVNS